MTLRYNRIAPFARDAFHTAFASLRSGALTLGTMTLAADKSVAHSVPMANHDNPKTDATTLEVASETAQMILRQVELFASGLLRASSLTQIAILLVLLLAAEGARRWLTPKLETWVRAREGMPKRQLRWLVVVRNRLRGIVFVLLAWGALAIMQEMFRFPSRYYLIAIAANLATAWLIVAFATRLIKNNALSRIVNWAAWIWITLRLLQLDDDTQVVLDSARIGMGDSSISLWQILQGAALLAVLVMGARFITRTTAERLQTNEDMSPSMRVLAIKVIQVVFYGAAIFIGLGTVGIDLTGLAVLSGAIGVGLGFGLQKVVSNLVSGVIILLDKSIKPGDVISLGETFGWIQTLGARYASVVTRDGKEYLIPNEDLITGQVVNWSHSNEFVRLDIHFGTAYNDDPHMVRKIAIEAAQGVDRVLSHRPPVCHIVGFGDSSVDYILRFWIKDPTGGLTNIRGNVFLALWDAFREHGISIPFPQREVTMLPPAQHDADQPPA